jgi:hypothetical protein
VNHLKPKGFTMMAKHVELNWPLIQAKHVGPEQRPTAIMLSISSTTSENGAALAIAKYHHSASAPLVSYHYIVDASKTYRCMSDFVSSYAHPHGALSVMLCAQPHEYSPYAEVSNSRVMNRAASLIADLLKLHKIPVRYLDDDLEKKWVKHKWRRRGGIIAPVIGMWPYESFLLLVKLKLLEEA